VTAGPYPVGRRPRTPTTPGPCCARCCSSSACSRCRIGGVANAAQNGPLLITRCGLRWLLRVEQHDRLSFQPGEPMASCSSSCTRRSSALFSAPTVGPGRPAPVCCNRLARIWHAPPESRQNRLLPARTPVVSAGIEPAIPHAATFFIMDNRCHPSGVPPFPDVNLCHTRPASSRD